MVKFPIIAKEKIEWRGGKIDNNPPPSALKSTNPQARRPFHIDPPQ